MLTAQEITYIHPDKERLFENLHLSVQKQDKIALIGDNGTGKSTLLKILAGILQPTFGLVKSESQPYYIPQHFGQFDHATVAEALRIEDKLTALSDILRGKVTERNLVLLNDDWNVEERSREALSHWHLPTLAFDQKMARLSGGEKTKVFLAGILIHKPEMVLLDEPTNHLDTESREMLYQYVTSCTNALLVVSHDRTLLELLPSVYELDKRGITLYGGNYRFYKEQKQIEEKALFQQMEEKEKALHKAKKVERETLERKQRQDARGKKKQEKARVPRIVINTIRNKAEASSAKLRNSHSEKVENLTDALKQVRQKIPDSKKMKLNFEASDLHAGRILVTAENIQFGYGEAPLWLRPLSLQIRSGERIQVKGPNGSGKTSLLKILLGAMQPTEGTLTRADIRSIYIDQDYSLIRNDLTVYEQAQQYNDGALQEHEVNIRLNRYLFTQAFWDKPCSTLSGGEKMRLMLCCLMISNHAPDLFVLDEPTNNLDIQNIEMLTAAINGYAGTLLVVSHDAFFLKEIQAERLIEITPNR
jgi:ATPase subunit of ABC transporter with duplicated ATPase domains